MSSAAPSFGRPRRDSRLDMLEETRAPALIVKIFALLEPASVETRALRQIITTRARAYE